MKLLEKSILEKLADLEHDQWVSYTQNLLTRKTVIVSEEQKKLWETKFVNYTILGKEDQELDRFWARKVINQLKKEGIEFIGY